MPDWKKISLEIKRQLHRDGISIGAAAARLCITPQALTMRLSGREISSKTAIDLAKTFGFSEQYILTGKGELTKNNEQTSENTILVTKDNDIEKRLQERIIVEFNLFRLWHKYKRKSGVLIFEPINIGNNEHPIFINGLSYDHSERSQMSAACLASPGTNDKLILFIQDKEQEAPIFKTYELKKLYDKLKEIYPL